MYPDAVAIALIVSDADTEIVAFPVLHPALTRFPGLQYCGTLLASFVLQVPAVVAAGVSPFTV
jgi:hypothetical protein